MSNKQYILVTDPVSTGLQYIFDVFERGYTPIAFFPWLSLTGEALEMEKEIMRKPAIAAMPEETVIMDGDEDYNKTLEMVKQYDIVAVVVGSENGTLMGDRLAEDLGLKGNPTEFSEMHRDKHLMQEGLKAAGMRTIKGTVVRSVEEAREFLDRNDIANTVIKPVDGAGSVGLHFCNSREETLKTIENNLGKGSFIADPTKGLMLQERIVGDEYVVNTVSCNGRHAITDIWRYHRVSLGHDGNIYDYAVLVTELEPKHVELCQYALDTVEALGVKYGPAHGEFMLDDKGPVLIEVGTRPMGASLPAAMLDGAYNHHITDISLDSYLNPEKFEEFRRKPYRPQAAAMLLFLIADRTQNLNDFPLMQVLRRLPSLFRARVTGTIDTMALTRTIDLETAPGVLYLTHPDEEVMKRDHQLIWEMETRYGALIYGMDDEMRDSLAKARWQVGTFLGKLAEADVKAGKVAVLTTDAENCRCLSEEAKIIDLNDHDFGRVDAETAVLHLSGELNSVEDFMWAFTEAMENNGFKKVYVPEECCGNFPYGKAGLAHVLRINGFTLDVPTTLLPGVLCAGIEYIDN